MKIDLKGVARDVVLVGGLAEGGLSVAAAVGPHLPAADVGLISLALAGCGLIVSAAEDVMQGQSPISAISQAISGVAGLFGAKVPSIPAVQAKTPAPAPVAPVAPVAPAAPVVLPTADMPPEHPQPPVGG